ncbi:MepB family protein [Bacillus subtilis]|nr:MepB family protein [Bacillus subtilis]MEC0360642.1 MepB family protein [Bacillus subtilis]
MTTYKSENKLESGQIVDPAINTLPYHLGMAIKHVYEAIGMTVTKVIREPESAEYGACRFEIEGKDIVFREAKTTPVKIGQFVTVWKRPIDIIIPFDSTDSVDFIVIGVSSSQNQGQFVFDKRILIEKGIMSHNSKKGKTAFRVYPPWTEPVSKQAVKTHQWQLRYFFPFGPHVDIDKESILKLFNF